MKDDLDSIPEEPDACESRTPHDHKLMFKTLENPLRRKIIKSIGVPGITKKEIMEKLDITEEQLKFQVEYLVKMCYIEVNDDVCRLNEKGIDLLSNIK